MKVLFILPKELEYQLLKFKTTFQLFTEEKKKRKEATFHFYDLFRNMVMVIKPPIPIPQNVTKIKFHLKNANIKELM